MLRVSERVFGTGHDRPAVLLQTQTRLCNVVAVRPEVLQHGQDIGIEQAGNDPALVAVEPIHVLVSELLDGVSQGLTFRIDLVEDLGPLLNETERTKLD